MIVLIAVKGGEDEVFFQRLSLIAPLDRAETIILAHVIDSTPRGGLELGRERYVWRRPLPSERSEDLIRAEEDRARAGLAFARHALASVGVRNETMREVVIRGKPNEVLCDLASREGAALIVVRGRSGKPGPHSVGKTARFLIDHAPAAALLVR